MMPGPHMEWLAQQRQSEMRMEAQRARAVHGFAAERPVRDAIGGGMIRLGFWIAGARETR